MTTLTINKSVVVRSHCLEFREFRKLLDDLTYPRLDIEMGEENAPKTPILSVNVICHPLKWLKDFYIFSHDCFLLSDKYDFFRKKMVPKPNDLEGFIYSVYKDTPEHVGKLLTEPRADSYYKLEEMPWNVVEFAKSLDKRITKDQIERAVKKFPGIWGTERVSRAAKRYVDEREKDFIEHFDF